ncbi:hypothetical protein LUZ60_004625 [Juncus effusus]|nr:hypothetical protein LUZ60_004625 [Juncus effusus]
MAKNPEMNPNPKSEIPNAVPTGSGDIESGGGPDLLYPKMMEDPKLRWGFIRKVYSILSVQFLFTAGVAIMATFVKPIPAFLFSNTRASWAVFVVVILSPFTVMWPMIRFREKHPLNIIFLAIFTLCISLSVGISCITVGGKIALQAAILTAVVVVGLTLYTFWAVKRGQDFTFLFPFLFVSLLVIFVYALIQVLAPLGKVAHTIYGCLATLLFSGFIVYDTNQLIKRYKYNEYVIAAISLYMDVINLFMSSVALNFSGCAS